MEGKDDMGDGYYILNAGCEILDAGYKMMDGR